MKRLSLLVGILLAVLSCPVHAQQATLNAPVTRNAEDNLRVESIYLTRDGGGRWEITVSVRDSGGAEILGRRTAYSGPDAAHAGATVAAANTAIIWTVRGGETGTNARKTDFRALGWLVDQGYIAGVTLVP